MTYVSWIYRAKKCYESFGFEFLGLDGCYIFVWDEEGIWLVSEEIVAKRMSREIIKNKREKGEEKRKK